MKKIISYITKTYSIKELLKLYKTDKLENLICRDENIQDMLDNSNISADDLLDALEERLVEELEEIRDIDQFVYEYLEDTSEIIHVYDTQFFEIEILKKMDPIAYRCLVSDTLDFLIEEKFVIEKDDKYYKLY